MRVYFIDVTMTTTDTTYALEEVDAIMASHIHQDAEILRNNLRDKRKYNEVSYV